MQFNNLESDAPQRVRISWEMLTQRDLYSRSPEQECDGYWPSLDPRDPGFIGENADLADFDRQYKAAKERLQAFENGDWYYMGVRAKAFVHIPIGSRSFRMLELESSGLWGVESDSDASYLESIFADEREELLSQLRTLGASLTGKTELDEEMPEDFNL